MLKHILFSVIILAALLCAMPAKAAELCPSSLWEMGDGQDKATDKEDEYDFSKRKGFVFEPHGFGQLRYRSVENDKYVESSDPESTAENFSVERLWLTAKMKEHTYPSRLGAPPARAWEVFMSYDLAADNAGLVDFFFWYFDMKPVQLQGGQMRIPFGWQILTNPSDLVVPGYSQVSRALFDDFVDQGARLCGDLLLDGKIYYSVGVYNGIDDKNGAFTGQLGWQPYVRKDEKQKVVEQIKFDLYLYYARYELPSPAPSDDRLGVKMRTCFSWKVLKDQLVFQGEIMSNIGSTFSQDGGEDLRTNGYFVELGYYMLNRKYLPALRWDVLDQEDDLPLGRRSNLAAGFKYFPREYISFQMFYELRLEQHDQPNGMGGSELHNDRFTAQVTLNF